MSFIFRCSLCLFSLLVLMALGAADDESSRLFPASQIPIEEPTDKFTSELYNMLITLGLFVAVIIALTWILKRILNAKVQQDNVRSNIKVVERRNLSPKSGIYILEVFGKTLIVAESPAGFQHLATMDATLEEDEPPQKSNFEQIMDRRVPPKD